MLTARAPYISYMRTPRVSWVSDRALANSARAARARARLALSLEGYVATYDMHWNNVRNHKNSACIRVRVNPNLNTPKGSKANDSLLLPTINQLNSTLSALANFSSALPGRLSSTDSTPTNHLNNNKSQGVEGGKLFVVVGGEGVVVLAGLLCVACYQTRTSARTRVDSAHLSRRRAIPSFCSASRPFAPK